MRISTQSFFQRNLSGMGSLQEQLLRVQQKLGSGTKFLTPSEDPVAAARALRVGQSLAETAQYAASRARASQALSTEEGALGAATTVLQDVKALIVQAGNGTLTDADRATLGTALESSFAQLLGIANTDDGNGQFLFAGYQGDRAPFALQADGSVQYLGDQGQRLMQVDVARQLSGADDGRSVFQSVQGGARHVTTADQANTGSGSFAAVGVSGGGDYAVSFAGSPLQYTVTDGTTTATGAYQPGATIALGGLSLRIDGSPAVGDVFRVQPAADAGTDVFGAIRDVIAALKQPLATGGAAAQAALRNALSTGNVKLTNAHDNVLTVRSAVGSRMAELEALDAGGAWRELTDRAYLSELQDLDYASAISEFSLRQTNLQATQQTFARLQEIALFKYL